MSAQHTQGQTLGVPKPNGKTRAEFMESLMADGMTLGGAMALADAAGKQFGYKLSHEQMFAITEALAAARLALADTSAAAPIIRADALGRVNAACVAIAETTGSAS